MIKEKTYANRVNRLLETITPDLLTLLKNAPAYGSCGIEITLHNDEIARVELRSEISKLLPYDKLNTSNIH